MMMMMRGRGCEEGPQSLRERGTQRHSHSLSLGLSHWHTHFDGRRIWLILGSHSESPCAHV